MVDLAARCHMRSVLANHLPPPTEALAANCEHALFCYAQGRAPDYRLASVRAVEILKQPKWRQSIQDAVQSGTGFSFLELFGDTPPTVLFDHVPAHVELRQHEESQASGVDLLASMTGPDTSNVPDAGIRCQRCGSSDIAFEFLQTRAADEGTTVYCTCTGCRKRWRMN